jgi:hypothetical protein
LIFLGKSKSPPAGAKGRNMKNIAKKKFNQNQPCKNCGKYFSINETPGGMIQRTNGEDNFKIICPYCGEWNDR